MPPRLPFGPEPDWVGRARQVFSDYYLRYDIGDAQPDPEDPGHWLRCSQLGRIARNAGLRPRKYLAIAEEHLAALETAGLAMPDREHHIVHGLDTEGEPEVTLFSRVATAPGERVTYEALLETDPGKLALRGIFRAHYGYHIWARDERYVLTDKLHSKQLLAADQGEEIAPSITLVDTGPELLDRQNRSDAGWIVQEARMLAQLAALADEPMPQGNPLRRN